MDQVKGEGFSCLSHTIDEVKDCFSIPTFYGLDFVHRNRNVVAHCLATYTFHFMKLELGWLRFHPM